MANHNVINSQFDAWYSSPAYRALMERNAAERAAREEAEAARDIAYWKSLAGTGSVATSEEVVVDHFTDEVTTTTPVEVHLDDQKAVRNVA